MPNYVCTITYAWKIFTDRFQVGKTCRKRRKSVLLVGWERYGRPGVAMARGVTPTIKGEPVTVAKAPEGPSIAKAKTSLEPRLATYKKAPSGDTVIAVGVVPAGNGDPLTAANAPVVALAVNADTLLEASFATYKNDPFGVVAIPEGVKPVAKGEPAIGVKAPVASIESADTKFWPWIVT